MTQLGPRQRLLNSAPWLAVALCLFNIVHGNSGALTVAANEIGFIEQFALADDRAQALEQLIPGTEEHYFYSCLHAQHAKQFQKVDKLLVDWIKRHGETVLAQRIKTRQMLLQYDAHPRKTLDYLRDELGLHFSHQRDRTDDDPKLPTVLDSKIISRESLLRRALRYRKTTDGFTEQAFDWLINHQLNPLQRRHLLQRLTRPDYPGLVKSIIADLKQKDSRGFGSLEIHKRLLREQLEECLSLKPDLLNKQEFVAVYLRKLAPNDDVDWQYDRAVAIDYVQRVWEFAERLDSTHNSLKAHILYRRLVLDRAAGVYDKSRFMEYLKLPRHAHYVNPQFMRLPESRRYAADLNYNSQGATLLRPIGNDEPLVRSYLQHFFVKEDNYNAYEPFVADRYLKSLFAETKITSGIGDASRWYTMLEPSELQALKDRIDLEFVPTNPASFDVDDDVQLDLYIKNVENLIVKVFRINTGNYYREQGKPVNTDIQLDGLVANEELSFEYDEPSERRILRSFKFPQLKEQGVYVIDFIGNGISSRAVVRKGALRYTVRTTAAGQAFTVLNEANKQVTEATLWVAGQEFEPQEDGTIIVPFSTKPGPQPLVITHQGFAALHQFDHQGEEYELKAAFYVDREALIRHRQAAIVVRPRLFINGTPVGLGSLENARLLITSIDHDGTATSKEVPDFELHEDRESTYVIQVPTRLNGMLMQLHAEIEQLSLNKKVQLTASKEISINEIDRTPRTEDLHFLKSGDEYVIEVLGRSGEVRRKRPVRIELKHRDFRDTVSTTLQSDGRGQIALGRLEDLLWIKATGTDGAQHQWSLPTDQVAYHRTVHGIVGDTLRIPYSGGEPGRADLSLLSTHRGTLVADVLEKVQWRDGFLELTDLQPGNYLLTLKHNNSRIKIRVTAGTAGQAYALGNTRLLELRSINPLHITSVDTDENQLTVRLGGATKYTRVHVLATRYQPAFNPFTDFAAIRDAEPTSYRLPAVIAQYVAGRDIGDEYRYVLDRKYADKFPGNMLKRPSLLLNPWAIRDTQTGQQLAAKGEEFAPGAKVAAQAAPPTDQEALRETAPSDTSNLDFLSEASVVFANLRPDKNGVVSVAMDELAPHQHLHVVAIDPRSTIYRQVALPVKKLEIDDLRLVLALDPTKHYAQRKQITVLDAGASFTIRDVTTAKFDYYDSLSRIYRLYATLSQDTQLAKFEFITRWPQLNPEEKREKYSEFACHELHYFLMRKDPEFFTKALLPYLASKKDKTFLDHWLLDDPLDEYFDPWQHARLNIVERILLGQRVEREQDTMRRHVRDLFDLVPRDVNRFNYLFSAAVRGRALDSDVDGVTLGAKVRELSTQLGAERRMEAARSGRIRGMGAGGVVAAADKRKSEVARRLRREAADEAMPQEDIDFYGFAEGASLRDSYRRLYVQLEKTKEWVENNYYQLPIEAQNADLVRVNAFWNDLAQYEATGNGSASAFFSRHWAEASNNFTEMMLALASIDLPFEAQPHKDEFEGAKLTLTATSPMVIFHEQIQESGVGDDDATEILVSQNFFRQDDRYEVRGGVRRDKFVTDEFLVHTVYGCQAVITNPTSAQIKAEVLLQVPAGAIPVAGTHYTRSVTVDLAPYSSQALEYQFYFPLAGEYEHFPVHVSDDDTVLGFAQPAKLKAVDRLSKLDTKSWAYVSQFGTNNEVLTFLAERNVHELDLTRIAFRMKDKQFFSQATDLLRGRHAYSHVLWSYSIHHQVVKAINEFLVHADALLNRLGPAIVSELLTIEPVERRTYQHREYWPLVNARAHQLGRTRRILNNRFHEQYHALMQALAYQPSLDQDDLMSVTYYMLLQDRVADARKFFERIDPDSRHTKMQYDYLTAYLDCFNLDPKDARAIVARYADHPVDRWRERFEAVGALLEEIDGKPTQVVDARDREQNQARLASSEPRFDVSIKGTEIRIDHKNLETVRINYYLMDLELLFSRNPFVTEFAGQFSHIFPNDSQTVQLRGDRRTTVITLPQSLQSKNVLIEIVAAGETKSVSYYSNSLLVEVSDSYGQLRVIQRETGKPLPAVYVKVYAEMQDSSVRFHKDGYTDLRGKFDYTSLSTNELDAVRRFSILVISDEHGAVVREAAPPKQ